MKVQSCTEAGQFWAVVQKDQLTKSSLKAEDVASFQMDCLQESVGTPSEDSRS